MAPSPADNVGTSLPRANDAETPGQPYVLAWNLIGKRVTVVGGGAIGTAKVETLLDTGAHITVIDPTPCPRAVDLGRLGRIRLVRRKARPTDVVRSTLVVAATGDSATNRRIRRWAKPFGAVVNAVDDKRNCDVTVPAVIHRGPATVAITTAGASPAGSRFLREELTDLVTKAVPADVGSLFDVAQDARKNLRAADKYRYDYQAWRQLLFEPGMEAIRRGRTSALGEIQRRFEAEFEQAVTPIRHGKLTLVGAGPGGVDLITVRGARAIESADVIVYDRLVDPDLLNLAPVAAERIPVGKAKGSGVPQDEICTLLVERALSGDNVVRLKGGDPFVFGRGAEEVEAAEAAGLSVSVVPGLSSALAGPALAGIPVTDRRLASSFTVLTGHKANDDGHDWEALARSSATLVVLMASSTADSVATSLCGAGRSGQELVAFVHDAGSPRQKSAVRSLAEVMTDGCPFPSPSVMIIGPVVEHLAADTAAAAKTGSSVQQLDLPLSA